MTDTGSVVYDDDVDNLSNVEEVDMDRDATDRESLRAIRELHIDALTRAFEEIHDNEAFEAMGKGQLNVRRRHLQSHFEAMEKAHILYRQICVLSSDDIYTNLETQVLDAQAKLEDRLDELSALHDARNYHEQVGGVQVGSQRESVGAPNLADQLGQAVIRIEAAQEPRIGKFNGNPADWPAFRDLFVAEVHAKDYDPVKKLLYLQNACTGKAAATLGPWQPISDNYAAAWEVMKAAYNDEYHVIHGILGRAHAIKRQESEDHNSLRTVLDEVTGSTRQLETMADKSVLWDQMWIHMAKQRLPRSTLDSWEQFRNRNQRNRMPTLEEFKDFLDTKARARREYEFEPMSSDRSSGNKSKSGSDGSGNRFRPYDRNDRNRPSGSASSNNREERDKSHSNSKQVAPGTGPPSACPMQGCGQTHYLGQCDKFRALSLTDRLEETKRHRLCRGCLNAGHMAYACARTSCMKCPESKMKHHFRLCPKTTVDGKPNEANVKTAAPTNR